MDEKRESIEYDVVIIGAGPSGLTTAIKLKQLAKEQKKPLRVCVLEKGAQVGAHILSGAIIQPNVLTQLFPQWQAMGAPLHTPARGEKFYYLTKHHAFRLPTPPQMRNKGNYIISLGALCRWLEKQATDLAIDIYPGFAASEILYNEKGQVIGVATGDFGINKTGLRKKTYQNGIALLAKQTVFAEGCRGTLTQQLFQRFQLTSQTQPQTYGIGLKELWRVKTNQHKPGFIMHSVGWPLDTKTYGGSFLYHLEDSYVSIGFVIGLDYQNPWLNPFNEMQRFKTHPLIKHTLAGGERIAYGARAINEGGYQSIPKVSFPGGVIVGDAAGFLNVVKIKGIHNAMKSGMLAAEAIFSSLKTAITNNEITTYPETLMKSSVFQELHQIRNVRPAFRWGLWAGLSYAAIESYLLRGKEPWTFSHRLDHKCLKQANKCKKIHYLKPDKSLTFDRLESVYYSNTYHEDDQPCHLVLKDTHLPISFNLKYYAAPEQRYCPAGVYEIIYQDKQQPRLQINAQNCIHCKVCDIKDPSQNIVWVSPEGSGGPNYSMM